MSKILCSLEVSRTKEKSDDCIIETIENEKDKEKDNVFIDNGFNSKLIKSFIDIWQTGKFSDISLVADSRKFPAHKFVLCMHSQVFAEELREKDMREIIIRDFDPEVVEEFIKYLYTGTFSREVNLELLLQMSTVYKAPQLKLFCENCKTFPMTLHQFNNFTYSYGTAKNSTRINKVQLIFHICFLRY